MSPRMAEMLSIMLGADAGVGCSEVSDTDDLFPEEANAVAQAIPSRRAEFAAGRRAARDALTRIGHTPVALPVAEDRAPVWPDGVVGSITHDKNIALAAVLLSAQSAGLGIDVTDAAPLPEETRAEILQFDAEMTLSGLEARAVFSAKESLFKALFPQVHRYFGFDAAEVRPDLDHGTFEVRLTGPLGPYAKDQVWRGDVAVHGSLIVTALRLPAS